MKRYPLESLLGVREAKVDDATNALGAAVREREAASRERAAAAAAREEQERAAAALRAKERAELEAGALTVADLARQDAWQFAASAEAARLASRETQARSSEQAAQGKELGARAELVAKKAEADVVDKDKARFVAGEKKRALAKEEEQAEEAWRPRRT